MELIECSESDQLVFSFLYVAMWKSLCLDERKQISYILSGILMKTVKVY